MIRVISIPAAPSARTDEGSVRTVLSNAGDGTRVEVSVREVDPGKSFHLGASSQTRVAYLLEGNDVTVSHTRAGATTNHRADRRSGLYLEPGEEANFAASGSALVLLIVTVPKHLGKPVGDVTPAGYFFEESQLRTLIDEKGIRRRTFWVNRETGLSNAWDLQIGRMKYAPHAYSPRHVHQASKTGTVTPEHFYLIETGTGEVKHDTGTLPVGPGSLVLIPAGEWHQLVASETGFDYIEFQAPFDFATTMDHDPLGKNWYISGTDDGAGKPKRWVQS
jgi:mannose-6-phosphate isomerase-like protein (cupin superfamily)